MVVKSRILDNFSHFFEQEEELALIFISFPTVDYKANSFETLDSLLRFRVFAEQNCERADLSQKLIKQISFVICHDGINDLAPVSQSFLCAFKEVLEQMLH